jgi:hypothetical protein
MIHPKNKFERRVIAQKRNSRQAVAKRKVMLEDGMIDPTLKMLNVPLKKKRLQEELELKDYDEKL